jgi:hypothetical protein
MNPIPWVELTGREKVAVTASVVVHESQDEKQRYTNE